MLSPTAVTSSTSAAQGLDTAGQGYLGLAFSFHLIASLSFRVPACHLFGSTTA